MMRQSCIGKLMRGRGTREGWAGERAALPLRPVAEAENPCGQQEIADGVRGNCIAHAPSPAERGRKRQACQSPEQQVLPIHQILHVFQAEDHRRKTDGEQRQAGKGDSVKLPADEPARQIAAKGQLFGDGHCNHG